jgi:hypothetical protein
MSGRISLALRGESVGNVIAVVSVVGIVLITIDNSRIATVTSPGKHPYVERVAVLNRKLRSVWHPRGSWTRGGAIVAGIDVGGDGLIDGRDKEDDCSGRAIGFHLEREVVVSGAVIEFTSRIVSVANCQQGSWERDKHEQRQEGAD